LYVGGSSADQYRGAAEQLADGLAEIVFYVSSSPLGLLL
jgi:hypothetical protein